MKKTCRYCRFLDPESKSIAWSERLKDYTRVYYYYSCRRFPKSVQKIPNGYCYEFDTVTKESQLAARLDLIADERISYLATDVWGGAGPDCKRGRLAAA